MKAVNITVGMHMDEEWTVTSVEYALSNLVPAPPGHIHIADIVLVEMESPAYPMHAPNTGPKRTKRTWFRISETIEVQTLIPEGVDPIDMSDPSNKPIVIIESPYAGDVERNLRYLRAAMRDSLLRGEAPYASHALYTQPGVLDDEDPAERRLGMDGAAPYRKRADRTAFYTDLGTSSGIEEGLELAEKHHPVVRRSIPDWDKDNG